MIEKIILLTVLFNFQTILSQNIEAVILSENIEFIEDPAYDATISTEKPNFLDSLSSIDDGIPIFLVDEGLVLVGCEKEVGIEKIKKCSVDGLESILKEKLTSNLSAIFHKDKDSRILISTNVIIDTTGKVKYQGVRITLEGLKVQEEKHEKLATEVELIVKGFPKLSPAKMNGILQTVRTKIKAEIIILD